LAFAPFVVQTFVPFVVQIFAPFVVQTFALFVVQTAWTHRVPEQTFWVKLC